MVESWKITFWFFLFRVFNISSIQEEGFSDFESKPPEYMQLIDSQSLILNDSYCLERITAKVTSHSFYGDHNKSSNYIKIMWDSKTFMTSIKVESDSLNDTYCEAENKHYYYRKPLNQNFHVFPDEVHEGFRFLPIKLDCKYVITPELDGRCSPLKLRYSTPVCVDNGTCTCRKVSMSGPNLEGELSEFGVTVYWSVPKNFKNNISSVVISIYSEDWINIKKIIGRKIRISDFSKTNSIKYKEHFKINITSETVYRIQGYFENTINCRGNSTFMLFRHSGTKRISNYEKIILYATAVTSLVFFFLLCLLYFWKKQLRRIYLKLFPSKSSEAADIQRHKDDLRCKDLLSKMVWNPSYVEQSRDSYLFDFRDLVIIKEIASGNFGIVYLAYSPISLKGCNEFAIKQIKDTAGPEVITDFIEEINMFRLVGDHSNVVKMFGYCSTPQPLTIIMEYVPFNLLSYLKDLRAEFERKKLETENSISYAQVSHSRSSSTSTTNYDYISQSDVECMPLNNEYKNVLDNRELEIFGLQIAKGMAHLESRNIVHRDLAARNVLMDNARVLKISDFGMSKTGIYVNKRSKKFPLRWMSPEALVSRIYSNKSDVWSFGVVLWEIGTLGAFPYSSLQNEEVISLLEKGGHLDKPENVTAQLYQVMVNCWARLPDERPTFRDLVEKIEGFCQKSNGYVDFENLESNYVFPPMEEDIEQNTSNQSLKF